MKDLLEYVNGVLLRGTSHQVDPDTPLFDVGMVDSLKILQLIAFVETRAGRAIPDHEVVMSNFQTVRTIAEHFFNDHERVS